jgi:hypothetical protein
VRKKSSTSAWRLSTCSTKKVHSNPEYC